MSDLLENFSPATLRKARTLIEKERVKKSADYENVWNVEGSQPYIVTTDGESWVGCNCPNGKNASFGRVKCYHAASALLVLRGEEGAPEKD